MGGQLAAILVFLAIVGVVMWRVNVASSESAKLEARQEKLADYTRAVEAQVNTVQETIREMLGAPFNTANPEGLESLATSTDDWIEELEASGALIQAVRPPDELVVTNVTLQQSFMMFSSSAKIYALVEGEESSKRIQDLLDRAAEVRGQAGVVMASALGMLDQARQDAEMPSSGIDSPGQMTPIIPSPAPVEDKSKDKSKDSDEDKKSGDG